MSTDLGPLLAAVTDEFERGLTIAERAGIDPRTAGPRLKALERDGLVVSTRTDKYGGVSLYARGPKAPALTTPFQDLLAAVNETYGGGAQVCLLVLDLAVNPPHDIVGYLGGVRIDMAWGDQPIDDVLRFAAHAVRAGGEEV